MMRKTAWVVLLVLCGCMTARPRQTTYSGLQIRHGLLMLLGDIQEEFRKEIVLCLLGDTTDGEIRIDGLAPARISDRTTTGVLLYGCDDRGVVALYHNHVPQGWDGCTFSPVDIQAMEKQRWVHALVLSCERGFVFRFRGDDREEFIPMPRRQAQKLSP